MLPASGIIREVIELDQVSSTNTFALDSGREGLLVIASEQTRGRGRKGRSWLSSAGANVLMTLTVAACDPRLAIVAGVAMREGLAEVAGGLFEIKWPNDIIAQGKKVCGILCESRRITAIGIGINVNQRVWPPELEGKAISLAEITGRALDRSLVTRRVTAALDTWLTLFSRQGFEPVREAFLQHGMLKGHAVFTEEGSPLTVVDLDMQGHLTVNVSGSIRELVSSSILLRDTKL